jgi:hypothetical protein
MAWVNPSCGLIFAPKKQGFAEKKMKLFVYYKFLPNQYPELKTHVQQMQVLLQTQFPQLSAQVMKRPTPDELGQVTWMEIYELGSSDLSVFKLELERAAAQEKLPNPRRTELFVNC